MKRPEIPNDMGVIRIADEVVSTIAGLAAIEVEGVASMSGGWGTDLVEKLGKKNFGKGIRVEINDQETSIDIFISIMYGYRFLRWEKMFRREVRTAVET